MRWLVLVLLLANAAVFAWSQGWLVPLLPVPSDAEREPARLAHQVRAQSVTVLSPKAAAQAASASESERAASSSGAVAPAPN